MALASGDILVYDGTQWNNQPSIPGPFSIDSPTLYVDATNHRVGIGTTTPAQKLTVSGDITTTGQLRIGSNALVLRQDPSFSSQLQANIHFNVASGFLAGFGVNAVTGTEVRIKNVDDTSGTYGLTVETQASGTKYFVVRGDGHVGIGTTSPNFTLDVNGDVRIESSNKLYFGGTGSSDNDTNLYRSAANILATDDDFALATSGKGIRITEGSNPKMGVATLSSGSAAVSTTAVKTNSRIMLTPQNQASGTPPNAGHVYVSTRTDSTSFTITSTNASDDRNVAWIIFDPA